MIIIEMMNALSPLILREPKFSGSTVALSLIKRVHVKHHFW